ncbi:MAG TPA: hypothetical protein VMJ10_04115 [Kofleriaceae bacterium]|nr:hypothetical protein [Kofleriaceae bacterium]
MKQLLTKSICVCAFAAATAAHADDKLIPGVQHDPPRFVDESTTWIRVGTSGDGYFFDAQAEIVGAAPSDRVRLDWTQGGRVLATVKCNVSNDEESELTLARCEYRGKSISAKGAVDARLVYEDDKDDKQYLLRTYKLDVRQWAPSKIWQIAADDLLATAYVWHGSDGQVTDVPIFRFWIANSSSFHATLRCTVGGARLPDFDGSVESRNDATIEADIVPPKGDRQTWHWEQVQYEANGLKFGKSKGSHDTYLADHPGDYTCDLRKDGVTIRQFLFTVNADGRIQSHAMQQGKGAAPLAPNVALIDVRIAKDNGLDKRIKPDLLRKSRAFGLAWPDDPSVKAVLAALPPAYENAHPVAVHPKGKRLIGADQSPPRFIEEALTELRISGQRDGYEVALHTAVPESEPGSDRFQLDWKSGGKIVATFKCDWGNKTYQPVYAGVKEVTCEDRDHHAKAAGPIEADLVMHDDSDGNDYVLRTFKVNVVHFTSFGDPVWQIVPDDLLASAYALRVPRAPDGLEVVHFTLWVAHNMDGVTDLKLRCTVDGAKLDDARVDAPTLQTIVAEPRTKDGKSTRYVWSHIDADIGWVAGPHDAKNKGLQTLFVDHPGKWDCMLRADGKAFRELLFTVDGRGMIAADPMATGRGAMPMLATVVPVDVRIPKDSTFDDRVRPDAMRKSRGFGLAWPDAPNVKAIQAALPPSRGLPDPR